MDLITFMVIGLVAIANLIECKEEVEESGPYGSNSENVRVGRSAEGKLEFMH